MGGSAGKLNKTGGLGGGSAIHGEGKPEKTESTSNRPHQPGEGLRSLKTSNAFRVLNFELYAKPNIGVMVIGGVAIVFCAGYLTYMNYSWDRKQYYSAEAEDGSLILREKKSRWES